MNVFISWSGDRSKILAKELSQLLPELVPTLNVWMSEQDIDAGSRWGEELNRKLETSNFGVLCLTQENLSAPWLLFEAGSLAKSVSQSKVVPYRLGLKPTDIPFPLAQFQGVDADEVGTKKLVQSLNSALESPIKGPQLDSMFKRWWPDLKSRIEVIPASVSQNDPAPAAREIELERQTVRKFYTRIAGAWWERIPVAGIGFFQIELDELHNSVQLEGRFFDAEGSLNAYWNSAVARVVKDEKKIVYLRRCWHPARPNEAWFHGFGEMGFEGSPESFNRGQGKFCGVDQGHPEKTVVNPVELRRVDDANKISTMTAGIERDIQSLVLKTLHEW